MILCSNIAFSITYIFASIKLRFSEQKRAVNLLPLGFLGLSWGSLGAFWGSLGAFLGSLGLSKALLGSSKIIAKNSTGSPQGDFDPFFAMILEHVFFRRSKILAKNSTGSTSGALGALMLDASCATCHTHNMSITCLQHACNID